MKAILYRFRIAGPIGIGDGWGEAPFVRSDTLFSAVCHGLRDLFGPVRLTSFLRTAENTLATPPVRFSSAFPVLGQLPLLPAPRGANGGARWVSPAAFSALVRGESLPDGPRLHDDQVAVANADADRLTQPAGARLWAVETRERATVDRADSAASLFVSRVGRFAADCSPAVLALVDDEWRSDIEASLRLLGDSGIGGDRSSGLGTYRLEISDLEIPEAIQPNAYCTLSLYVPTVSELGGGVLAQPASYQLVDRSGWVTSPEGINQRRKRIRMVAEGSLLSPVTAGDRRRPPSGQMVDVTPEGVPGLHRVFRAGWAFSVGVSEAA